MKLLLTITFLTIIISCVKRHDQTSKPLSTTAAQPKGNWGEKNPDFNLEERENSYGWPAYPRTALSFSSQNNKTLEWSAENGFEVWKYAVGTGHKRKIALGQKHQVFFVKGHTGESTRMTRQVLDEDRNPIGVVLDYSEGGTDEASDPGGYVALCAYSIFQSRNVRRYVKGSFPVFSVESGLEVTDTIESLNFSSFFEVKDGDDPVLWFDHCKKYSEEFGYLRTAGSDVNNLSNAFSVPRVIQDNFQEGVRVALGENLLAGKKLQVEGHNILFYPSYWRKKHINSQEVIEVALRFSYILAGGEVEALYRFQIVNGIIDNVVEPEEIDIGWLITDSNKKKAIDELNKIAEAVATEIFIKFGQTMQTIDPDLPYAQLYTGAEFKGEKILLGPGFYPFAGIPKKAWGDKDYALKDLETLDGIRSARVPSGLKLKVHGSLVAQGKTSQQKVYDPGDHKTFPFAAIGVNVMPYYEDVIYYVIQNLKKEFLKAESIDSIAFKTLDGKEGAPFTLLDINIPQLRKSYENLGPEYQWGLVHAKGGNYWLYNKKYGKLLSIDRDTAGAPNSPLIFDDKPSGRRARWEFRRVQTRPQKMPILAFGQLLKQKSLFRLVNNNTRKAMDGVGGAAVQNRHNLQRLEQSFLFWRVSQLSQDKAQTLLANWSEDLAGDYKPTARDGVGISCSVDLDCRCHDCRKDLTCSRGICQVTLAGLCKTFEDCASNNCHEEGSVSRCRPSGTCSEAYQIGADDFCRKNRCGPCLDGETYCRKNSECMSLNCDKSGDPEGLKGVCRPADFGDSVITP